MNTQSVNILLVDDDAIDVRMLKRAFTEARILNPITVAGNGEEALAILRGEAGAPPLARPYLIVLDINMPRMDGHEFLAVLREDEALRDSIVFVLTTSRDSMDRHRAYQKNVAGYIIKQDPVRTFMEAIGMLQSYWRIVELPA